MEKNWEKNWKKLRIAPKARKNLAFLKAKTRKSDVFGPIWGTKKNKVKTWNFFCQKKSKGKSWGENSPDFDLKGGFITLIARYPTGLAERKIVTHRPLGSGRPDPRGPRRASLSPEL